MELNRRIRHAMRRDADRTLCQQVHVFRVPLAPQGALSSVDCPCCVLELTWLSDAGGSDDVIVFRESATRWAPVTRLARPGHRGRLDRPVRLELCLECGVLRGRFRTFDNLCLCDRREWDEPEVPWWGDLASNVSVCSGCMLRVLSGGSRWSPYFCRACLPQVVGLNRRFGFLVCPVAPHSIANQVSARVDAERPMAGARATAFGDQLRSLFDNQTALAKDTAARLVARARALGFTGDAVGADEFMLASAAAGHRPDHEIAAFLERLADSVRPLTDL